MQYSAKHSKMQIGNSVLRYKLGFHLRKLIISDLQYLCGAGVPDADKSI